MKFKKIILPLFLTIVFFITSNSVQALEKPYYINNNGVEMTKEQYDKIAKNFSEALIRNMSNEQFEFEINHEVISKTEETKYFLETTTYNILGETIGTLSKEISKEEYLNYKINKPNIPMQLDNTVSYNTTTKGITLATYIYNIPRARINVKVSWDGVPKTKSYDVIAARWDVYPGASFTPLYSTGVQTGNDRLLEQRYQDGGNNMIKSSNGIGISMNIFDNVTYELNNELDITGELWGNMEVAATYQHATKNVTLAQSKSYSFSANGLGGVLYYSNATIRGYYDGMGGVKTTF